MSSATTLEKIVTWASAFTAEERSGQEYYYVPEPVKRLEWSLFHAKGQLLALTGLQGTGKTSALNYIASVLAEKGFQHVAIKWTQNWLDDLFATNEGLNETLERAIVAEVYELLQAYGNTSKVYRPLGRRPTLTDMKPTVADALYERVGFKGELLLGKGGLKDVQTRVLKEHLDKCDAILIDLPDYTKSNRGLMDKHLQEVQSLWQMVVGQGKNIVTVIQKELFGGHFFFGKMMAYELKPFKPEELASIFRTQFPNCDFVSDEALILLGQKSRGVFRRFLKYLKLSCEFAAYKGTLPVSVEHVAEAVSIDQILNDMKLELSEAFKDSEKMKQVVQVLERLRQGDMTQKGIAEFLNIGEHPAGKLVSKLALYDYVTRNRGEGNTWLISLKVSP